MAGKDERGLYPLLTQLGMVAERAGDPVFYRDLLMVLGSHLRADLAMVMRYSRHHAPEYLIHDGLLPGHMEFYLRGLYRVDPIYRLCRDENGRGVKDLTEVSTPAERAGDYFNIFLRLTGMADDLALLFPIGGDASIGLVYERKSPFLKTELAAMRGLFPLLESLHRLHQKLSEAQLRATIRQIGDIDEMTRSPAKPGLPPIDYKTALDGFLRDKLTPRERDIVRLILVGYPNAKIAERLELSLNTVKNHKKRMYLKLDITTERELFLNFVNFLFQDI
ncbi:MAG: LuxR family transcriptional regulator [Rhodospirillaceae bacterium]|nr:MAG: LuxR family transcriptional regulator [Rhodospirillaceae bacterium]